MIACFTLEAGKTNGPYFRLSLKLSPWALVAVRMLLGS
jgi:hypothetical protein